MGYLYLAYPADDEDNDGGTDNITLFTILLENNPQLAAHVHTRGKVSAHRRGSLRFDFWAGGWDGMEFTEEKFQNGI